MTLEIAFLDVGNADSIIILTPSAPAIVIDAPYPKQVKKWLKSRGTSEIDALFFTHAHVDHLPHLTKLMDFITDWIEIGKMRKLYLPIHALQKIGESVPNQHEKSRIRDAFDRLDLLDKSKRLEVDPAEGRSPLNIGDVTINVLHPRALYSAKLRATHPTKVNEISIVLRIDYGHFRALLLADIENEGIKELSGNWNDLDLKSQIVKIPHHGAWQKHSDEALKDLMQIIDPELAVLSVGSRNQHKHVVPQLFLELLSLKRDDSKRLTNFVCTQMTRTCVCSAEERNIMGKQGLHTAKPCAGDIEILAETDGKWEMKNQDIHQAFIATLPRAACCDRAELVSVA